jgi:hypothetical protein
VQADPHASQQLFEHSVFAFAGALPPSASKVADMTVTAMRLRNIFFI